MDKPLFIPLKKEFFQMFFYGQKDTEYRPFGPRWNAKTCTIGRPVVLSCGYGKHLRLRGVIVDAWISGSDEAPEEWRACYGDRECSVCCIRIRVEEIQKC
jgi:hypothetical protein